MSEVPVGEHRRVVGGALPSSPLRALVAGRGKTCRCGHGKVAHEHYRRGSDCALCGCRRFGRPSLLSGMLRRAR